MKFVDHSGQIKIDDGVDVDNDEDLQMNGADTDSGDHELGDSSRPRKIRRYVNIKGNISEQKSSKFLLFLSLSYKI